MANMKVELHPREDKNGSMFHLGKLQFPGSINCSDGVTFLVFLSEDGEEELQVATINNDNTTFSKYSKRNDRVRVSLDSRKDKYGKKFYVGKLMFRGTIDCSKGMIFIIFTSKDGCEELQVVGPIKEYNRPNRSRQNYNRSNYDVVVRGGGYNRGSDGFDYQSGRDFNDSFNNFRDYPKDY